MESNPFNNFNPFLFMAKSADAQMNPFNPFSQFAGTQSDASSFQNLWLQGLQAMQNSNSNSMNPFENWQNGWLNQASFMPNQWASLMNQMQNNPNNNTPWSSMNQDWLEKTQNWQNGWQEIANQKWQQNLFKVILNSSKQNANSLSEQMGNIITDWGKYDLAKFLTHPLLKDLQTAITSDNLDEQKAILEKICQQWLSYSKNLQRLDIVAHADKSWLIQGWKKMVDDSLTTFQKIQSKHFDNEDQKNIKSYLATLSNLLDSFIQLVENFSDFEPKLNESFIKTALSKETKLKDVTDLFNLWCTKFDECYNKQVLSDQYQLNFSQWVNAISDFKIAAQKITDKVVEQAGLPSNREMNTVHKRLHQVFKANVTLEKEVNVLQKKVDALTKKMAEKSKPAVARDKK